MEEILSCILQLQNGEPRMNGTIRAKGKCPVCKAAFTHIPKIGFLCPEHKTVPQRVYIDLFWEGMRIRIFSDKQGQILDSYQRALNIQAKMTYEIENHQFDQTKYIRTEAAQFWIDILLDKFLQAKIASIAPSYKGHYRMMVQKAKDFFGTKDIRDLRKLDLNGYKEELEKKAVSNKTIKNYMDLFKAFLRWCKGDLEIIEVVPAFPKSEIQEKQFVWLSSEDQEKLIAFVPDEDKPIIAFLMLHGCRPAEARALKMKDVDLQRQVINIKATFSANVYRERRKGRGAKPLVIPIHPEFTGYLADRVSGNLPETFLFLNPRTAMPYSAWCLVRIWREVREKAEISGELRLYDASRHSFASQLVNSGTSLFTVSKLLGHSSTKMTEKYAHANIESFRADVKKLSLKNVVSIFSRPSPDRHQHDMEEENVILNQ